MKTTDLIITTTHLTTDDLSDVKGMHVRESIRSLILRAKQFGLNTIVVLGAAGDDILRALPELDDCDLTFDFNYTGEIFSSIHSGIHAASGAAFVLPADCEPLSDHQWKALDRAMWSTPPGQIDVYRYVKSETSDQNPAYPQLITLTGIKRLMKLPTTTSWLHDPNVQIQLVHACEPSVEIATEMQS